MSQSPRRRRLDNEARVRHMLDAANRAIELFRGKKVGELEADDETALALARLLEIREAAGRVTPELKERHPEIPWRDVADTRNRVVREYFDVDMEVLEAIIRDDLPSLMGPLESTLKELEEESMEDICPQTHLQNYPDALLRYSDPHL